MNTPRLYLGSSVFSQTHTRSRVRSFVFGFLLPVGVLGGAGVVLQRSSTEILGVTFPLGETERAGNVALLLLLLTTGLKTHDESKTPIRQCNSSSSQHTHALTHPSQKVIRTGHGCRQQQSSAPAADPGVGRTGTMRCAHPHPHPHPLSPTTGAEQKKNMGKEAKERRDNGDKGLVVHHPSRSANRQPSSR